MRLCLLILLFFLTQQVSAQDCADLRDGEIIRLDEKGKSLENLQVQDQDGVGSCYANSTSLLLQSVLDGHPQISYLHMATLFKKDNVDKARAAGNFNIHAMKATSTDKAVAGSEDGMARKWDLALDTGLICELFDRIKTEEIVSKKPVICKKSEQNLENILGSSDPDHKQFKTFLESSLYMNEFQKEFGAINEKRDLLSTKKNSDTEKKYDNFKKSFESLLQRKTQKLAENECSKINTDNIDSLLLPMAKEALGYKECFQNEIPAKYDFWCRAMKIMTHNPVIYGDGSMRVDEVNPELLRLLKNKIRKRTKNFTPAFFYNALSDSIIDLAGGSETSRKEMRIALKGETLFPAAMKANLNMLSEEYNEVLNNGYSPLCAKRHIYTYAKSGEFELDWKADPSLCSHVELMKQATNVIIKYKESGLNDMDSVLNFLLKKAGDGYDTALMSLYAADCNDSTKVSIPKNLKCEGSPVSLASKPYTDKSIMQKLKNDKPISITFCSDILKKTKSNFKANECGRHAVTLIGAKCVGGKYKYLMQNSWGSQHKSQNNPGIENVEGRGAYWFDEENFYNSVEFMNTIN